MKFGSLCSGIEAASCAWEPLGWKAQFLSEIEPFPSSVLDHHYPTVPNLGDMTKFKEWDDYGIDVLVGGTPCQSFSVAGLRKGLDDPRGNLMLTYLAIADRYRPEWLVWENVPGVLSSNGGRDFGTFLGGLGQLGYGFAYRVLDAQYFGVAQRRKRVFVVANSRGWQRAAAVLFEQHSLQGHPAPRRQAGEGASRWPADCASTLNAAFGAKLGLENQHINEGAPLFVPVAVGWQNSSSQSMSVDDVTQTLDKSKTVATAYSIKSTAIGRQANNGGNGLGVAAEIAPTLTKVDRHGVANGMQVRRLTPVECERLQGFPDNYTNTPHRGKPASDGGRYKALGNSMAVPCMSWLGRRIQMVEDLCKSMTAKGAA
jgi:DNA (cytosine-5)-methyltransferase 1